MPTSRPKQPISSPNNPELAGQRASKKVVYGASYRYATYAVHTRFEAVEWFTSDTMRPGLDRLPEIVRQAPTFDEAIVHP